jgi:SAM-dependent methyltransferase
MKADSAVIIPYLPQQSEAAGALARSVARIQPGAQLLLVGSGAGKPAGAEVIDHPGDWAEALRVALPRVDRPLTAVLDPDPAYPPDAYLDLLQPLRNDTADAVFGVRAHRPLPERALASATRLLTRAPVNDPLVGQRAFRTEALRALTLRGEGEELRAELLLQLCERLYRISEVPVAVAPTARRPFADYLSAIRSLVRHAAAPSSESLEGYATLARLEGGAPNYNAWLGARFREHAGARVLEVGAGIGTITAQLEAGRERMIALEVEPFYVERLTNRFRGKPHVRPYLADVALADWESLRSERLDTLVLSNVLEHIEDDAAAVRRFRQVLVDGGRALFLVPALPALFGALDEAVGHFRRYTPESLRTVLEGNGFVLEKLEFMNLVGIPGWFFNGRVLRRRVLPPLQLRLYDQLAPYLARAEGLLPSLPVGMSLFAVARAVERG